MTNIANAIALTATYATHTNNADKPLARADWAALFPCVTPEQWVAYVNASRRWSARRAARSSTAPPPSSNRR